MSTTKFDTAVETYLAHLCRIRASGGATGERSYYAPLTNLINAIGGTLRPKVFCVGELAQQGAGHPDIGLYNAKQVQRGRARQGQVPECGVMEVKPVSDDAWLTASSDQVSRYWNRYRLVLVTNTRDFVLLGEDTAGNPVKLETLRLAQSAKEFESKLEKPRAFAREIGAGLGEYLCRALSHPATLVEPRDVAWLLASYARDGLARVEAAGDTPSLAGIRSAFEEALGVRFEGERGAAFFRSSLVQTLFYGVFSAWVLWSRQTPSPIGPFNWREAAWHLRAPVLRALFQQLSDPGRLRSLGLVEVLDWTAAALDRVERDAFFDRFDQGEAVPYFYSLSWRRSIPRCASNWASAFHNLNEPVALLSNARSLALSLSRTYDLRRRRHTDAQRDRHSAGPQPSLLSTTIDKRFNALLNVAAYVQSSDSLWAVCLMP